MPVRRFKKGNELSDSETFGFGLLGIHSGVRSGVDNDFTKVFNACKEVQKMKRIFTFALVVFLSIGCANMLFASGQQQTSGQNQKLTFYVVTHASPSDSFWPPVFNGAQAAAKALGVSLQIIRLTSAQSGSIPAEVANLETAISAHPDGILLTVTSDTAFSAGLQEAQQQGIPVIAINTIPNNNDFTKNPFLAYVGQDNYQAESGPGMRRSSFSTCRRETRWGWSIRNPSTSL